MRTSHTQSLTVMVCIYMCSLHIAFPKSSIVVIVVKFMITQIQKQGTLELYNMFANVHCEWVKITRYLVKFNVNSIAKYFVFQFSSHHAFDVF